MDIFEKYYKKPLKVDKYCPFYIWTKDNEMAFNYLDEKKLNEDDISEIQEIVNVLNGISSTYFNANIHPEHNDIIQIDGEDKIMIRGWGNLTAHGSHNLKTEEAIKIQDSFAKWIVEQLRKKI